MIVQVNNTTRKQEFFSTSDEGATILSLIREVFDIEGDIVSVSHDGNTQYGVYMLGKPTVSPVDLTGVELDPGVNNLISFKLDMSDSSIRTKIYRFGNSKGIEFDKPIITTGEYLGEDTFTVYYTKDGTDLTKNELFAHIYTQGFIGKTIYIDSESEESIYTPDNVPS
jgi:hypothetical protein